MKAIILALAMIMLGALPARAQQGFVPGVTFNVPVYTSTTIRAGSNGDLVTYKGSFRLANDVNGMERIHVNNLSGGQSAQSALYLENNSGQHTWFVQEGPGLLGNWNGYQYPNTAGIIANTNAPFWLATNPPGHRFDFWLAGRYRMSIDQFGLRLHYNDETLSQIFFNEPVGNIWASEFSGGWDNLNLTAGAYYHWGWVFTGPGAQLINLNSDNSIGFYPQWPWVRNAYFDWQALHMPQRNDGSPYDLGITGSVTSSAQPWTGHAALDTKDVAIWVPRGGCAPVTYHSGLLIASEDWYTGRTCAWNLGGNIAQPLYTTVPAGGGPTCYFESGQACTPRTNNMTSCFSGGWYWLCQNLQGDTVLRVMMLVTRHTT